MSRDRLILDISNYVYVGILIYSYESIKILHLNYYKFYFLKLLINISSRILLNLKIFKLLNIHHVDTFGCHFQCLGRWTYGITEHWLTLLPGSRISFRRYSIRSDFTRRSGMFLLKRYEAQLRHVKEPVFKSKALSTIINWVSSFRDSIHFLLWSSDLN